MAMLHRKQIRRGGGRAAAATTMVAQVPVASYMLEQSKYYSTQSGLSELVLCTKYLAYVAN